VTLDVLGQVNWLALIIGALVYFALGAVWFTPVLFARPWQRAIGWDESRATPEMNPMSYALPAVLYVIVAIATAMLAVATGSNSIGEGLLLGLVIGIGYAVTLTGVEAVFDPNKPQPWVWFAITGAYHLIGFVIVAVLVSIWR
jgi:hypothetical protein